MTEEHLKAFAAHPRLLELATEAAHAVSAEIGREKSSTASGASAGASAGAPAVSAPRVDVGAVGSSDVWRQSPALIEQTHAAHQTLCEEMEAHALAQVCRVFEVPFVAIKDVANSEIHPEPIQLEPTDHIVPETCQVGVHAARVTARALEAIADEPTEAFAPVALTGAHLAALAGVRAATAGAVPPSKRAKIARDLNAATIVAEA